MDRPHPAVAGLLHDGFAHHQAGRLAQARSCYLAILALEPGHADSLHLLGLIAHRQGDSAGALDRLGRAVGARPDVAHFHGNFGIACLRAGDLRQAERCFRSAIALQPDGADAHVHLGLVLLRGGREAAAEPCFRTAIRLAPGEPGAYINLGATLLRLGRAREAAGVLGEALRLRPDTPEAHCALGLVFAGLGQAGHAEACYRAALRLRPGDAAALNNLGVLLCDLGRLDEAEAALDEALRLRPDDADTHSNLGNVLLARGWLGQAEAEYVAALRLHPLHADAQYNLGVACLLAGRLAEGWEGFEWRWRRRGFAQPRDFAQPRWNGQDTDAVVLLHAEQGFGDSIQMARFIPAIAARIRVILEVPPALARLFGGLRGVERVVASGEALPPFDLHCPLMSLPYVLGTTLDSIPAEVPYLRACPADIAAWRRRLDGLAPVRVGLAWAGNADYAADRRRSLAPSILAALGGIPGVAFVSLQKDASAGSSGLPMRDWTGELRDFADTAALVAALDLVICVDTAVAHLAGALGRPVWLLNRFDSCWRWMLGRDDSPWYPTLRQFRQPAPGDWDSVLGAVRAALRA